MKKKMFTLLLSVMLVFGTAGSALAAEKDCGNLNDLFAGKAQAVIESCLSKYFDWNSGASGGSGSSDSSENEGGAGTEDGTEGQKPSQPSQNGANRVSQVVSLVNWERSAAGLDSLSEDSQLTRLAQRKAEDMAEKGYFSHTSPTYGSAFDMMQNAGVSYRTAGENIAKGQKTAETVMSGWMNSSGHRANILGSGYTRIGVGYAEAGNGTPYWVQIFAG